MADSAQVVKGRLIGPTTVELYAPVAVSTGQQEVEVVLPATRNDHNPPLLALIQHLQSLPPGTRTRDDIDRQIQAERESWE